MGRRRHVEPSAGSRWHGGAGSVAGKPGGIDYDKGPYRRGGFSDWRPDTEGTYVFAVAFQRTGSIVATIAGSDVDVVSEQVYGRPITPLEGICDGFDRLRTIQTSDLSRNGRTR